MRSPAHALIPPESPNEARQQLERLNEWPCEGVSCERTLADVQAEPGVWFCGGCWNEGIREAHQRTDAAQQRTDEEASRARVAEASLSAARAENQRLADALAATVQRRGELEAALDYCQQQRRSLQESATQQVEGLRQEVATLKGRLEEVGAQLLCTVRECAALLRRLRGAA